MLHQAIFRDEFIGRVSIVTKQAGLFGSAFFIVKGRVILYVERMSISLYYTGCRRFLRAACAAALLLGNWIWLCRRDIIRELNMFVLPRCCWGIGYV